MGGKIIEASDTTVRDCKGNIIGGQEGVGKVEVLVLAPANPRENIDQRKKRLDLDDK